MLVTIQNWSLTNNQNVDLLDVTFGEGKSYISPLTL